MKKEDIDIDIDVLLAIVDKLNIEFDILIKNENTTSEDIKNFVYKYFSNNVLNNVINNQKRIYKLNSGGGLKAITEINTLLARIIHLYIDKKINTDNLSEIADFLMSHLDENYNLQYVFNSIFPISHGQYNFVYYTSLFEIFIQKCYFRFIECKEEIKGDCYSLLSNERFINTLKYYRHDLLEKISALETCASNQKSKKLADISIDELMEML